MAETPPAPAAIAEKFSTEDERAAARWGWHLGWAECQRVIYEALSAARDESSGLREEDLRTDLWRNLAVQPSMPASLRARSEASVVPPRSRMFMAARSYECGAAKPSPAAMAGGERHR